MIISIRTRYNSFDQAKFTFVNAKLSFGYAKFLFGHTKQIDSAKKMALANLHSSALKKTTAPKKFVTTSNHVSYQIVVLYSPYT